jgi:hypothetical protein
VVKRYEELAHAHRMDTGLSFMPEPETSGACGAPTDWTAYDAAVAPYLDGSYFADGVPSTRLDVPFSPGVDWGWEADCTEAQYTALAAAWAGHLAARGWLSRAIAYAYDEPPPEVVNFFSAQPSLKDKLEGLVGRFYYPAQGRPPWPAREQPPSPPESPWTRACSE